MKKLFAIILTACMLFSITALASETTFAGAYTIFDFGSESRLDDTFKANLLSYWGASKCIREENADSWTYTLTQEPNVNLAVTNKGDIFIAARHIGNLTYGTYALNNGWGTYKATGYNANSGEWVYGNEWVGKNQFIKIRMKNMSENTKVSIIFGLGSAWSTTNVCLFEISANDTEFQTYIIDGVLANAVGGYTWKGNCNYDEARRLGVYANKEVDFLEFFLFGAWGYTAAPEDITWKNAKVGAQVEIDYLIFVPTVEMANEYKSFDEGFDPSQTTTTESVIQTTTTESIVETTTTTESILETTTTESVVETTTTSLVLTGPDGTSTSLTETSTTTDGIDATTTESGNDATTTTKSADDATTPEGTTAPVQSNGGSSNTLAICLSLTSGIIIGVILGVALTLFIIKKK